MNSDLDDDQVDDSNDSDDDENLAAMGSEEETVSSLNESMNSNTGAIQHSGTKVSNKKSATSMSLNNQSTPNYASLKPMINNNSSTTPHHQQQRSLGQFGGGRHLLQVKSNHHHHHHHSKPARIRTVLNEKQLHTLRACYGANPRPDALMKEQLVEMTGLNPRVIRVWFQNKRCKDKKKNMLAPLPGQPQPPPSSIGPQMNNHLMPTNGTTNIKLLESTPNHLQHASQPPTPSSSSSSSSSSSQPGQMRVLNLNPPPGMYNQIVYNQPPIMFDNSSRGCY